MDMVQTLTASTYVVGASGVALSGYVAATGKPLPGPLPSNLPTTVAGRRLKGAGGVLFFVGLVLMVWGLDKPQRGLTLLALPFLLFPGIVLTLIGNRNTHKTIEPADNALVGR